MHSYVGSKINHTQKKDDLHRNETQLELPELLAPDGLDKDSRFNIFKYGVILGLNSLDTFHSGIGDFQVHKVVTRLWQQIDLRIFDRLVHLSVPDQ